MVADVRSVGSIGSGTGNFSGLGMPAGVLEHDVVVIAFESDIEVTVPSGWEQLGRIREASGSATTAHAWAKRVASGGSIAAPSITNPGWDHWIARSIALKDVPRSGNIADHVLAATSTEATADTSVSFPAGGTPTEGNSLWLYILTMGTDQGSNNTTRFTGAFSNSGLTALTERVDNGRADGNGGVLGVWSGRRLQASNPGTTTGTSADSDTKAMITLGFKTAPASELPYDSLAQSGSSTTDTTAYTTAGSMNPEANNGMVAYVLGTGTAVAAPTLSGLGLTWGSPVEVEEVPDASTTQKLWMYIASGVASPTIGTVTITFPATATGCSWHFERVRGAASLTPVQQPKAATTTTPANLSLTWSARTGTKRRLFAYAVSPQSTGNTVTPESPWIEEAEIVRSTPNIKLGVWREEGSADDSTTIADDSSYDYCAIGLELDFAAAGTPVGKDLQTAWNTAAAVGDDAAVGWHTYGTVGDQAQMGWNTLVAVGEDLQSAWAVFGLAGEDAPLAWRTAAAVGEDAPLGWATFATIGEGADLAWRIYGRVGEDLELGWATRALVGDTAVLEWRTYGAVGEDAPMAWRTFAVVGDTAELGWAVAVAVGEDAEIAWRTAAAVGEDQPLAWRTYQAVGDEVAVGWRVYSPVGEDAQLEWRVFVPVGDQVDLGWRTFALVGEDVALGWAVESDVPVVGVDLPLAWNTRALAGDDAQLGWRTYAAAGRDLVLAWRVYVAVAQVAQMAWRVRSLVGEDAAFGWSVWQAVGASAVLRWNVASSAPPEAGVPIVVGAPYVEGRAGVPYSEVAADPAYVASGAAAFDLQRGYGRGRYGRGPYGG